MRVLRVEGRGEVRLTLKGPFVTERYSQLLARVRRSRGRPSMIAVEWLAPGQTGGGAGQEGSMVRDRIASRSWEVLALPLEAAAWDRLGTVGQVTLRIQLDGAADGVDLDFLVLAP